LDWRSTTATGYSSPTRNCISPDRKLETSISEGMQDPGGMAIDNENRFLYVADAALDQVLVYDADKFTLIRKLGTAGKNHTLTAPGQFARPTNVGR
jgi:DNA-binding beta-propeller fold protein YncE